MGDDGKNGTTLSLMDTVAYQLIGKSVDELLGKETDFSYFPKSVYDSLIDTKALFQISLNSSHNLVNGTYSVHQLSKNLTSIDAYNRSHVEEESIKLSKMKMKKVLVDPFDSMDPTNVECLEEERSVKTNLAKELEESEYVPQKKNKVYMKKDK